MVPIVAGFLLILSKFFFSFDSLTMASKPPTHKRSRARRETCDEVVDVFEAADLLVLLLLLLLVSLQLAPLFLLFGRSKLIFKIYTVQNVFKHARLELFI